MGNQSIDVCRTIFMGYSKQIHCLWHVYIILPVTDRSSDEFIFWWNTVQQPLTWSGLVLRGRTCQVAFWANDIEGSVGGTSQERTVERWQQVIGWLIHHCKGGSWSARCEQLSDNPSSQSLVILQKYRRFSTIQYDLGSVYRHGIGFWLALYTVEQSSWTATWLIWPTRCGWKWSQT